MIQFFLILIFTTYFLTPFSLATVSGYGITSLDVVMLFFFIYIFKRLLWDGDKLQFTANSAFIFLILMLAAAFISSINPLVDGSPKLIGQYFKTFIHFLYFVVFNLIAATYPIKSKNWTNVVRLWMIIGMLINIFAVYQIIARAYDLPLAWLQYNNVSLHARGEGVQPQDFKQLSLAYGGFFRATSIFSEPSALASFNIFMVIYSFIPYIQGRRQYFRSKIFIGFFLLTTLTGLFLTFSMTGVVGFVLVLGSAFLFEKRKNLKTMFRVLFISLAVVVAADIAVESYADVSVIELFSRRIEGIVNYGTANMEKDVTPGESFGVRINSGSKSLLVWQDYPITGIGLGLTGYNRKYEVGFSDFSMIAALAEMGIIGFLVFVGMFIALFAETFRFLKPGSHFSLLSAGQQRNLGMLFYLMLLQFEINFISGNNLVSIGLWIPVAMIFSELNNYYLATRKEFYSISFVKEPLRNYIGRNVAQYLRTKA